MKITYIERNFLDKYRCIDKQKEIHAINYFTSGSLYYFKINNFDYKVIEKDKIIKMEA